MAASQRFLRETAGLLVEANRNPQTFSTIYDPARILLATIDLSTQLIPHSRNHGRESPWLTANASLIQPAYILLNIESLEAEEVTRFLSDVKPHLPAENAPALVFNVLLENVEQSICRRLERKGGDPRLGTDSAICAALEFFDESNYYPVHLVSQVGKTLQEAGKCVSPITISNPIMSLQFISEMGKHQLPAYYQVNKSFLTFQESCHPEYLARAIDCLISKGSQLSKQEFERLVACLGGLACVAMTIADVDRSKIVEAVKELESYIGREPERQSYDSTFIAAEFAKIFCHLEEPSWRDRVLEDLNKIKSPGKLASLPARRSVDRGHRVFSQILRDYFVGETGSTIFYPKDCEFGERQHVSSVSLTTYSGIKLLGYNIDFLIVAELTSLALVMLLRIHF